MAEDGKNKFQKKVSSRFQSFLRGPKLAESAIPNFDNLRFDEEDEMSAKSTPRKSPRTPKVNIAPSSKKEENVKLRNGDSKKLADRNKSTKSMKLFKSPKKNSKQNDELSQYTQSIDLREIEICQQLGQGASSAGVFLVLVDGWACAMKQLKREYVCSFDIKCFERELDILYRLPRHPNIVRYLFHTTIGSDLCLFMQLYSGTLREYLDSQRVNNNYLNYQTLSTMALEIVHGIQFLHSHGVIHRDIKVLFSLFFFLFFSYFLPLFIFFRPAKSGKLNF